LIAINAIFAIVDGDPDSGLFVETWGPQETPDKPVEAAGRIERGTLPNFREFGKWA
jgi:hypothetical protein